MTAPAPRRCFGVETEYGFSVTRQQGRVRENLLDRFFRLARRELRNLPCRLGGGMWLSNGARFYVDCGSHPEFCTPEAQHPLDVVRYAQAGDTLLARLAARLRDDLGADADVLVFKCNVDYSGNQTTWACHESYSHRVSPQLLPRQLIPHFVSRIVFTGAGGLNPLAPGVEFCLSPRVVHLFAPVTEHSTSGRGIYHTKNEPLAGPGLNRLHVLCGDSVQSHLAVYLKIGTTALVLALAEAGLLPGEAVQLNDPLAAMKAFNTDPSGRVTAPRLSGPPVSALDVQRHYLELAERNLSHPAFPSWAGEVCRRWRETLEQLEQGPAAVSRSLDWPLKFTLYRDFARQRGFDPEKIPDLNRQLQPQRKPRLAGIPLPDLIRAGNAAEESGSVAPSGPAPNAPELSGENREELRRLLHLRQELCEIDVRFSRVGADGIFAAMDRAGQLDHRLPELTDAGLEQALDHPPGEGRARWRGEFVRAHSGKAGYTCDWQALQKGDRHLAELNDPFADAPPVWKPIPPPTLGRDNPVHQWIWDQAKRAFDGGFYNQAYAHLTQENCFHLPQRHPLRTRYYELLAWVQCRRGYPAEAESLLTHWAESRPAPFALANEFLSQGRFRGLVPGGDRLREWLRRCEEILETQPGQEPLTVFAFKGHKGFILSRDGRLEEARAVLEDALTDQERRQTNARLYARTLGNLADVWRQLDQPRQAELCLEDAERLQQARGFKGDLAEVTLANRAKLFRDPARSLDCLQTSEAIQNETGHGLGLARTILLQARLLPNPASNRLRRRTLIQLAGQVPALAQCPLMKTILRNWTPWTSGAPLEGARDFFWGL
jgi:proteasome accessory factor A